MIVPMNLDHAKQMIDDRDAMIEHMIKYIRRLNVKMTEDIASSEDIEKMERLCQRAEKLITGAQRIRSSKHAAG